MQNDNRRRQQFELERSLRREILESSQQTRAVTIASAYERLFSTFPDHSVFDASPEERHRKGRLSAGMIAPLLPRPARVLEVGCGRGDTLSALKNLGCDCVGVEPSIHMIDMCMEKNASVHSGTADKLDYPDNCFNAVADA
ncbi:MAG: methyltransferase domain-containing protein [Phycisphaerae bacterium]|nr:methyltransferase domain-containing protein [Phycisphaerae bacterium]